MLYWENWWLSVTLKRSLIAVAKGQQRTLRKIWTTELPVTTTLLYSLKCGHCSHLHDSDSNMKLQILKMV